MNPIPYGRHNITQEDIDAVVEVLRSDKLTQGPKIEEFEKAFSDYVGSRFAVAVANGTAALHLSALALDMSPGRKVITSPVTFAATANCIRYIGGEVDFADICPDTALLDLEAVRLKLESSAEGAYSGLIAVDFAGYPMDMEACRQLADEFGLWLIEDACHAPGGSFIDSKGILQSCGNSRLADLTVFSFHPVKHIAGGEGGMITTDRRDLYEQLLMLRSHGIIRRADLLDENHGGWYYEMKELGYNYRLTDIQAALAGSQLRRAEEGLKRRRQIAARYNEAFSGTQVQHLLPSKKINHAYHLYVVQVEDRAGLYYHLQDKNIFCQVHYIPLHLQPYYRRRGWQLGDLPRAEAYYARALSLPMYPSLSEEEQGYVIDSILEFV